MHPTAPPVYLFVEVLGTFCIELKYLNIEKSYNDEWEKNPLCMDV